jgi:cell wall hydrolase
MSATRTPWQWWEVCLLALVVWREARGASRDAKIAVACSVRNRVDNPKWWGKTYDQVITKKWQYSSMTAAGDPQLSTYPQPDDHVFEECLGIADKVYERSLTNPLPGADSYFDDSIAPPKWATPATFVGKIGRLSFYNIDGDAGIDI